MKNRILSHFDNVDVVIAQVLRNMPIFPKLKKSSPDQYFWQLCDSIIYQQLSGKAAATISNRFQELLKNEITPENVLKTSHEDMRKCGLSNAKANYVKNIAQAVLDGKIDFNIFDKMSDEDIIANLTKIKGVGRWTAEMFLIFTMGRENIFSFGDLGLKNGIHILYGGDILKKDDLIKIVENWTPYKTYASLALWKTADLQKEKNKLILSDE